MLNFKVSFICLVFQLTERTSNFRFCEDHLKAIQMPLLVVLVVVVGNTEQYDQLKGLFEK